MFPRKVFSSQMRPSKVEVAWASAHVSRQIMLPHGLKPTRLQAHRMSVVFVGCIFLWTLPVPAQEVRPKQAEVPASLPARPSAGMKAISRPASNFSRGQKLSISASPPARPTIDPRISLTKKSARPRTPMASPAPNAPLEIPTPPEVTLLDPPVSETLAPPVSETTVSEVAVPKFVAVPEATRLTHKPEVAAPDVILRAGEIERCLTASSSACASRIHRAHADGVGVKQSINLAPAENIQLEANDSSLDTPTSPTHQQERSLPSDPPRRLSNDNSPSLSRRMSVNPEQRPQLAAFQNNAATRADLPQPITPDGSETPDALSDLYRPVSGIDLRQATEIPELAEGDSPSLRQPLDLAQTILGRRTALDLSVSYWREWHPDRDSYPFCHFPLYFEDPNLERCGRGLFCFTTVASIGHFACSTALLPVHLITEPPRHYVRTLSDCPPCHRFYWDFDPPQFPW